MPAAIRPATAADLPALARLDVTYPADRVLAVERAGRPPEHTFSFHWAAREAPDAVYNTYTIDRLRLALARTDLFLVAKVDGQAAGFLMVIVPAWTDAAEITDLAVDRAQRRRGAGRALVRAAAGWARQRSYRGLWVEPRADNAEAIEFYLSLDFRLSGFNDRLYSNRDDEAGRPVLYMHLELG
jgi:ribosomal protein S18 acetylase RimI-like enzyme